MAQIFSTRFTRLIKLVFVAIILTASGAVLIWRTAFQSMVPVGVPVKQPVPFSHELHVQDNGIDCRYCHTSVEESSFAGLPATEICMTCHSRILTKSPALAPVRKSYREGTPLHWKRIHDLPDFVYFNHSIHIHKGIGCVSCHGLVDEMSVTRRAKPLTMQWCLGCHREPERFVRPREYVFDMDWKPPENRLELGKKLVKKYNIESQTDCSTCHR